MTASSGSSCEPVASLGSVMRLLRWLQLVAQSFQTAAEQRGHRRHAPAELAGDLLQRLAAAMLEDDDLALWLRQVRQSVGQAEQLLILGRCLAGRSLIRRQPAGQAAR